MGCPGIGVLGPSRLLGARWRAQEQSPETAAVGNCPLPTSYHGPLCPSACPCHADEDVGSQWDKQLPGPHG